MDFKQLGFRKSVRVRDIWQARYLGSMKDSYTVTVPPHGWYCCGLDDSAVLENPNVHFIEIGDEVEITARRKFLKLAGAGALVVPAVMGGTGAYGQQGSTNGQISDHGSGMFDVRAFGAKGDGTTIDTPAVNRAIEAASAVGGTVRFAAGQYLCYSIRLKSSVALYLGAGGGDHRCQRSAGRTIRWI